MKVFTVQEFEAYTPKRKTLALFGSSAEHSLSPALHNEIFRRCGVEIDYILVKPEPDEFSRAVALAREKLIGFNCTIPFKRTVVPFLDHVDKRVSFLGAANTVVVRDGELWGYNTDGEGFLRALELQSVSLTDRRVLLAGCGGAALSVAYEAAMAGAAHITCAARSLAKARDFTETLRRATGLNIFEPQLLQGIGGSFDVLVNATPVGMAETADQAPVELDCITGLQFVYDCIYNPPMPKLLKDADMRRILWDNGLSMLVLQGAVGHIHWLDIPPYPDDMLRQVLDTISAAHARERLRSVWGRSNLALTGFMGCGKTTIGQKLAKLLDMDFVDLDQKIEQEQKTTISDIFEKKGEMYFRALETRACEEVAKLENTVIATGGGTVIRDQNAEILEKSCLILFLNRTLAQIEQNLKGSYARPLLQVPNVSEHIKSLFDFRVPQYYDKSDVTVYFPGNLPDPVRHALIHI